MNLCNLCKLPHCIVQCSGSQIFKNLATTSKFFVQEVWHEARALCLKQKYYVLYKTLRYADP